MPLLESITRLYWKHTPHTHIHESKRGGKVYGLPVYALPCKCGKLIFAPIAGTPNSDTWSDLVNGLHSATERGN